MTSRFSIKKKVVRALLHLPEDQHWLCPACETARKRRRKRVANPRIASLKSDAESEVELSAINTNRLRKRRRGRSAEKTRNLNKKRKTNERA